MLRRQPTAITLLSDDIAIYDHNLAKRKEQETADARSAENRAPSESQSQSQETNGSGKGAELGSGMGGTSAVRSRQDRIMGR